MLRFVPDPARGEFVNLGIVVGDDNAEDWELRLLQNLRRAKALDDHGSLGLALNFAVRLQDHIAALDHLPGTTAATPISLDLIGRLSEEMQNVVQLSPPAPVVAESADAALDFLFDELVVDPAAPGRRVVKKWPALNSVRDSYAAHEVPADAVKRWALVSAGPYEGTFDYAVSNGRAVQLVQCWSFQLPNQADLAEQVKAWAWLAHEVRAQQGLLRLDERQIEVPSDVEIATVFVPPAEGQQEASAFDQARAAFEEIEVIQLTPDQADVVGEHAAERLQIPA
jgi:hypothetical protein